MKKINVEKFDEVALIVEKIIDSDDGEITLIVPRFSHLAESLSNFHLLKREAETLNKKIKIESVDNKVVEMAKASGLEAINPFLAKNKRQFSDIIIPQRTEKRVKKSILDSSGKKEKAKKEKQEEAREIPIKIKKTEIIEEENVGDEKDFILEKVTVQKDYSKLISSIKSLIKSFVKIIIILIIAAGLLVLALWVLPKADIKITTKKTEWTYNDSIIADKTAKADFMKLTVPAQVFSQTKNFNLEAPANGKKQVSNKARGKLIVYNSYSSKSQPLAKGTRLMSPDGKIFLLDKNITVPGAKIDEGKIVPSSIETLVTAEKPGEEYNIEAQKLFTIPGLKKTPKYQAFYGESKEAMSGGFVGEISYPTAEDIKAAKDKISQILKDGLKTAVYSQIPADFKILDGAEEFVMTNQTIKDEVNKENNFSVFSEARMTVLAFKEEDLESILIKRSLKEKGEEYEVKNIDIKYGLARADFTIKKLSFLVNFKAQLSYKINTDILKQQVAGQSEIELRKIIFSEPGLANARISLWPFWVNRTPLNLNKIKIVVD